MIVHDFATGVATADVRPPSGLPRDGILGGLHYRDDVLRPRGRRRGDLQLVEPISHVTIIEPRPRPFDWARDADEYSEPDPCPPHGIERVSPDGWLTVDL